MRRRAARAAACSAALLALAAALPATALADPFTDIAGSLNEWLVGTLLAPVINGLFQGSLTLISSINATTLLTTPFRSLFGHGTAIWAAADGVRQTVVLPVAHSLLALVMLVQLVHVSERVDGSATMPAVREVVQLGVVFVVLSWLINSSGEICEAVFDDLARVSAAVAGGEAMRDVSIQTVGGDAIRDFNALGPLLVTALATYLFAATAQVLAPLVCYARAIQLYAYLMLSPIPFALLGFDETRQMGVNFVRNFCALCLAGTVMAFVLSVFPALVNMVAADVTQAPMTDPASAVLWPLKLITMCLLLIVSLVRSGSWAREVLGG